MSETAIDAIGGERPIVTEEFARRAHDYALSPSRNRLKEVLDRSDSVEKTPPMLGIFNDIPWYQFRESEAHAWARAGYSWIVNDAEHRQREGWYGTEQNAAECRLGLLAGGLSARIGDLEGEVADELVDLPRGQLGDDAASAL